MNKIIVVFLILLLSTSCSSSGNLKVVSDPEGAEVFVQRGLLAPTKVGVTPLDVSTSLVPDLFLDDVSVIVRKPGHEVQSIFIPKTKMQTNANFSVNLKPSEGSLQCQNQGKEMHALASTIGKAFQLLMKKEYVEAEVFLLQATTKYPNISVIYDLLGNLYYLKRDLEKAQKNYRRSLEIDGNNVETAKILEKLSKGI